MPSNNLQRKKTPLVISMGLQKVWQERPLDRGRPVDLVYLDFAQAFDIVPHKHLIYKLRSAGVDHEVCSWVKIGYRGVSKCGDK